MIGGMQFDENVVVGHVCAVLPPVSPELFAAAAPASSTASSSASSWWCWPRLRPRPRHSPSPSRAPPTARALSLPAYVYTYVFRGTPLLVQLWVFYYGFGAIGEEGLGFLWPVFRDGYMVGLLTLTINTSAYAAEILRGGIVNVPNGQIEAAIASGMSWWTTMRRIVLPQAFRIAWPAYSNEVILLLKGSALVSTITVLDLMGQTRTIFARSYSLDIFLYAAVLYLILSGTLTVLLRWIEARMRIPGHGSSPA